jgi:hypothetical protein
MRYLFQRIGCRIDFDGLPLDGEGHPRHRNEVQALLGALPRVDEEVADVTSVGIDHEKQHFAHPVALSIAHLSTDEVAGSGDVQAGWGLLLTCTPRGLPLRASTLLGCLLWPMDGYCFPPGAYLIGHQHQLITDPRRAAPDLDLRAALQADATQIGHGAEVCHDLTPSVCLEQHHLVREIRPSDLHLFGAHDLSCDLSRLPSPRTFNLNRLSVHGYLSGPQNRAIADADPLTAGVELCSLLQANPLQCRRWP